MGSGRIHGVDSISAAASAALGRRLTAVADLGGSARTTVLRCRTDTGDTVVVKAYRDTPEALAAFTAEAAGLVFSRRGPQVLAVDRDGPLLVLADLATAPSLVDALLGGSPTAARSGLVDWATGYARLAVASIARETEFARTRA